MSRLARPRSSRGAWHHLDAELDDIFKLARYEHLARVLDAARFDGSFFADTLGLLDIEEEEYLTPLMPVIGQFKFINP